MIRWSLAAVLAAAAVVSGLAGGAAQSEPAWTLHYVFATGLYGGTSFEASADRRFHMVTNVSFGPHGQSTGVLSTAQFRRLQLAMESSHPETWSTAYQNGCAEHYAWLSITRAEPGRAPAAMRVQWGCGLTGVPSDLRAIILAVRTVASELLPGVWLDTSPSSEAVPVAPHRALTIVARYEYAPRTVELGSDGAVLRRSRVSAGLYPVADCPVRQMEPVDAATLVKLRALETPSAVVTPTTSSDTEALFNRVMSDCPAVTGGYTSPDVRVPAGVRWLVFYVRSPAQRPTAEPTRSVWVDSTGRFHALRDDQPVDGNLGAAAVHDLDRAVAAAHDGSWARSYPFDSTNCVASVQVIRIDAAGTRRAGQPTDLACDASATPPDVRALANAASTLLRRSTP